MSGSHLPGEGHSSPPPPPASPPEGGGRDAPYERPESTSYEREEETPYERGEETPYEREEASPYDPHTHRPVTREARTARPARATAPPARARLRRKLASRQELRDAFLLNEVIGPPVSLRDPRAGPQGR